MGQVVLFANTGQSGFPESRTAHTCFGDGMPMTKGMSAARRRLPENPGKWLLGSFRLLFWGLCYI